MNDRIQKLSEHTISGVAGSLINSIILVIVLWEVVNKNRLFIWILAVFVISAVRIYLQHTYKTIEPTQHAVNRWKNFFLITLAISGLIWGSAGVVLFPLGSIGHQAFVAFVLGGMVAGSVGVFSVMISAFLAFSIPALFPLIVRFYLIVDPIHFAMGTMVSLFWLIMVMTARRFNTDILNYFLIKYENIELISELETEVNVRKTAEIKLKEKKKEIEKIVDVRTSELQDANKKLTNEIEERRLIAHALQESEEKYRDLVENINDVIYSVDINGIVTYISPVVKSTLGYHPSQVVGKNFTEFVHPEDLQFVMNRFEKVISVESETSEYRLLSKSGDCRWIRSSSRAIYKEGRIEGLRGTFTDISEKKLMEAKLKQAHKMEAIGTLAGGVAHDLNNILSGIVSYPELILLDLPEDSPLRKPISIMQQSGEKAAIIVQDLLTLARRGASTAEVVNLNHIISEQLKSPEIEKLKSFHPGVKIEARFEKDLLNIKGSTVHLSKTVMNLISNGAESMHNAGTISIYTENRYMDRPLKGDDHAKEGDYVAVTISDTGIGISAEDIERIFEPFYTKKVMGRSGTGLGMAVVWGTVKDHEGYIDVESIEGKGTTFTLYFPATREEITPDKFQLSIDDYMGKGQSILVVDDVEEQRLIASGMLKKLGYTVNSVSSGEEAIDYLAGNSVDLLVLDMIMDPGIDGLETYKRILEINPEQKAIIASGFSETESVKNSQKLGAGKYIMKPYTLEKIGLAVKNELERNPQLKI